MAASHEPTRILAAFVAETHDEDLAPVVRERAAACLLDWIGAALSGMGSHTDRCLMPVITRLGGRGRATLMGRGAGVPAPIAALYNGTVAAVTEIDDVHNLVSLHPGIGVIPAALATAEEAGVSGRSLLTAVVLGYDLAVRVARAAGESHYRFWHSTGTCTGFGAAAAAGKLLGLDRESLLMALGLAGTQAAGLWESLTTAAVSAKHLHSGKAAFHGVLSALLARHGFRGSPTILEGPRGFLAATAQAEAADVSLLTAGLGTPFLIGQNYFKRYACCKACIEGIDGIRSLLAQPGFGPADIGRIVVELIPDNYRLVHNPAPATPEEAKFSIQFCLALAAVTGGADVRDFSESMLRDERIRAWMKKVEVRSAPSLPARARLTAHRADGTSAFVEPALRSLEAGEVRDKFRGVARPLVGARVTEALVDAVDRLECTEDLKALSHLLRRRVRCQSTPRG
jgi:2-methylcitrate dehydratase PrpD